MNTQSRIPKLHSPTFDGALIWFAELQTKGLMFHPDDDPAELVQIGDWKKLFSNPEISEVCAIVDELFARLGDSVYEAAYPIVMNAYRLPLDA